MMEHILDELRMREERKTCIVDELEKPFLTDVIHRNQGANHHPVIVSISTFGSLCLLFTDLACFHCVHLRSKMIDGADRDRLVRLHFTSLL